MPASLGTISVARTWPRPTRLPSIAPSAKSLAESGPGTVCCHGGGATEPFVQTCFQHAQTSLSQRPRLSLGTRRPEALRNSTGVVIKPTWPSAVRPRSTRCCPRLRGGISSGVSSAPAVAGSECRRRLRAPWPTAVDLEAETENGPDRDDDREHAGALQGWRDSNGSNGIRSHQQLQPK